MSIFINNQKLEITKFPNGEQKIKTPWLAKENTKVVLKWESDQDFINLMFLKYHMDECNSVKVSLSVLYFPYSRMDRKISGNLFTLKSICKFINFLNFHEVIIHEPHSDVTPALLDKCTVKDTTMDLFHDYQDELSPDFVFYPDAGAQKRYFQDGYPCLIGNKIRNLQTGRIEKYDIIPEGYGVDITGKAIVILDDLSSYGGTFLHAAKALKELGAGDIYLVVAHAENNILKGEIFSSKLFKKVLTTDSIIDIKMANDQLLITKI